MKITGKNEKLNPLMGLYIAAALLIVSIPVRMFQLFAIIEPATGFYRVIDPSVYIMYALAALVIIASYGVSILAKNIPASKSPFRRNKFLAVTSILLGCGMVLDVVFSASEFITQANEFITKTNEYSLFGTADSGQIPLMCEAIFGLFAAIYLLVFGISYIDGRTTYSQYKFLAITPFFWAMSRLVLRYIVKISYVQIADLMLELFGIAFMMIFFMSFARISSGLSNKKAMRTLFAAGSVSAFFLGAANIPKALMVLSGNMKLIPKDYPLSLCDVIFVFFIAAYIINAYKCAKENDSKELEVEDKVQEKDMETDDNFLSE